MHEQLKSNVRSDIFKQKTDKRICETLVYKDKGKKSVSV